MQADYGSSDSTAPMPKPISRHLVTAAVERVAPGCEKGGDDKGTEALKQLHSLNTTLFWLRRSATVQSTPGYAAHLPAENCAVKVEHADAFHALLWLPPLAPHRVA